MNSLWNIDSGGFFMKEYRLIEAESRLADIIWTNEPLTSPELVKLCREELNWKKSTTYTMLKKLEIKKIFINKNSIVSSLLSEEELYAEQSRQIVEEGFDGSLPRFLTAFTRDKKLTSKEIRELERLIDQHRED